MPTKTASTPLALGVARNPASLFILVAVGNDPPVVLKAPPTNTVVVKIPFTVVAAGALVCVPKTVDVEKSSSPSHWPPCLSRQCVAVGIDLKVDERRLVVPLLIPPELAKELPCVG